jgi:TonB family protein
MKGKIVVMGSFSRRIELVIVVVVLFGGSGLPALGQTPTTSCTDKIFDNNGNPVTKKVRILEKPNPQRTQAARNKHTEGDVILSVVLNASGKVTDITVIQGLPNGLTESSIKHAERIRFEPALKDGCPVSVTMQVAYSFTSSN